MDLEIAGSRRFSARKASVVASVFASIRKSTGSLTPRAVLTHARSSRSPLHRFFDWSDASAAEKHRLGQARELIASVRIRIRAEGSGEIRTVRAYIRAQQPKVGSNFVETQIVMGDDFMRRQVLQQALEDLRRFEERYQQLEEFAEVVMAARKVLKRQRRRAA